MATKSETSNNCKSLILKIIDVITSSTVPSHYNDTLAAFCKFCQNCTEKQSKTLYELINNKLFINSIIKRFKQFNTEILNVKKSSKKPANFTYNNIIEIFNQNPEIIDTEQRIEHCLAILINIKESAYFQKGAQIRSIFNRGKNNLFNTLSSILTHCKLYRVNFTNKIFRFLQQMLPPINTSKSKSFCNHFNVSIILQRCCDFMIYRMHIDGNGAIDETKNDYNDLYGIQVPLDYFMSSIISIVTYFISSKWHKQLVLNHSTLTSCISTVCIRLCHELQSDFNLKAWSDVDIVYNYNNYSKQKQKDLQNILDKMKISFSNNEYVGHNLTIHTSMEYLYYYSLK
eukprot:342993_1